MVAAVIAVVAVVAAVSTAVVDKPVGNSSCLTMVMTNWFWAHQQNRNHHDNSGRNKRQQPNDNSGSNDNSGIQWQ